MTVDLRRRALLLAGAGLLGLASRANPASRPDALRTGRDMFALGVAAGDPTDDGFVIWTRLLPAALDDPPLPDASIEVEWEVAGDAQFIRILRRGVTWAEPAWAHSVHVEVSGLASDRWYWYRFRAGGAQSAVGRGRTFAAAPATPAELRFTLASCQHFEHGHYAAYGEMARDAPDLVVHLGDYIYEDNLPADRPAVRRHCNPPPPTLEGYRERYACYKRDPHLQAAHAAAPWAVIWDDHEFMNDYAGDIAPDGMPGESYLLRRAAAYQAYWEHMPLRMFSRPDRGHVRLYRELRVGALARLLMLDARQYRSLQPCIDPKRRGGRWTDCPERTAADRTMLGGEQERWVADRLRAGGCTWNLLGQSVMMAGFFGQSPSGPVWWTDGWDGYPSARERLLASLASPGVANPVVFSGDIHAWFASDLRAHAGAPVMGAELVTTSISSAGQAYRPIVDQLPNNPHVRYFESRKRGYTRCRLTDAALEADFVAVDDVRNPDSTCRVIHRVTVEAGRPGIASA
ncbi:MAG: alkaline phosphatase D family protein [Sinimarinibacterium sp.]|jgi:alkaline phosphatase D